MPFSWSDLAGIVTRPPQAQYADFSGIPETVMKMRQMDEARAQHEAAVQAQQMAIAQRAAQAMAAEQGRHERAAMRGQQADAKLQLERDKLGMAQGNQQAELFRKAQADLENAVRMGDPAAIDMAAQHLKQLGFDVSGVQPQSAPALSSGALSGRPELIPPQQAQAFAGPAATAGVKTKPLDLDALDASVKSQGGTVNQGLPPRPQDTSPSPVNDQINAQKQRAQAQAAPPPQSLPGGPPQVAPQPSAPSPIMVRKGDKELLRLGAPGVDQETAGKYFRPLLDQARTPEEKRAAQIAMNEARTVTAREGIEKGREAGTKAYQFELNRLRKGAGGGGAGSGATPDYGGTGMSKAEYTVAEKDNAQARAIVKETLQEAHITKLSDSEASFQQMLGNLSAGSNLGNLGALKSFIKTTDDRISDADFRLAAGTGGAWNQLHQKLQYYLSLPDTTQMTPEFLAEIKRTAQAGLGALKSRKKEIATHLQTRLQNAEDLSPQARQRWGKSAWAEVGAEPQQPAGNGSGQGGLYERLRLTGK